MPVYRDKATSCFIFEFDRQINGQRVRARKRLPKTWNHAQADSFDRQESARLYAIATGVQRPEFTIEDAVKKYILERCAELKAGKNAAHELAQMFWAYQGRPMAALADVCKAYSIKERERLAPATIKNRIRYLTAACRYGWKHHGMADADPAAAVIVPTVKNERQTYIDREQMIKLARACTHLPTRAAIKIAFYSGMRTGEILRAVRADGFFVLADTKNGSPRLVPIHPKLNTCLKYPLPTRYILGYHFREARKAVDMEWLHFHDLRHSAASAMINSAVDLYTVGAVLGHKSAASTKRYAHLATASLKVALMKIGKKAA
ncbi:MAG: phage integrase [Proteobacteria bacterium]|nr:phage integrase [Pseudomonadota bacterium]